MALLPREHGAYGQMALPLVTSFAVAGVTAPALLIALAVVAGFVMHEPLSVLLGRRGAREQRAQGRRAAMWLGTTAALAVGAGLMGAWLMPPSDRWSLLLPVLPAALLGVMIHVKREKSALGEVAVALAFSSVAVPVCVAAGAPIVRAFAVGIAFALIFVVGTLAVRMIVVGVRGGGDLRVVRSIRMIVLVLTAAGSVALATAALRTLLPWVTLSAVVPGLTAAVWLVLFPPAPTRLRTVGWTLVAAFATAAVILIVGLAGAP
jgi:hypothetical protein